MIFKILLDLRVFFFQKFIGFNKTQVIIFEKNVIINFKKLKYLFNPLLPVE